MGSCVGDRRGLCRMGPSQVGLYRCEPCEAEVGLGVCGRRELVSQTGETMTDSDELRKIMNSITGKRHRSTTIGEPLKAEFPATARPTEVKLVRLSRLSQVSLPDAIIACLLEHPRTVDQLAVLCRPDIASEIAWRKWARRHPQ